MNLQFLTTPNSSDWLYITDINGGTNYRPRTKKITVESLLANVSVDTSEIQNIANEALTIAEQARSIANTANTVAVNALEVVDSKMQFPLTTKTTAENSDFIVGIGSNGLPYKITKTNLFGDIASISDVELLTQFSIASNGNTQLTLSLGIAFLLNKVTTSVDNIRVRLYLTQAFANADIARAIGGDLPVSHGLIYDAVFSSGIFSLDVLPCATASPNSNVIAVINNLSSTAISNASLTFNYLQLR